MVKNTKGDFDMTKEDDKTINIHQDYILFQLRCVAFNVLHTMMCQVQKHTKYCQEYEDCYKYYTSKLLPALNQFKRLCRKCQDAQEKKEKKQ